MTRSSLMGGGLALAAILLIADGAWGQSGSAPPTWRKPATSTVPPAAAAKPAVATGWEGAAGTGVLLAIPPSQSTARPAPAALGWARVKPGQPLNAGKLNLSPPGTHASNSRPADSSSTPAQARTVSCQISALHPGWQWMATNHSTQTFVPTELVTFRTHYPYASSSIPASARDSNDRATLSVPLQPGGSVVLLSINNDLDAMTAPPTCEVETVGNYVVQ